MKKEIERTDDNIAETPTRKRAYKTPRISRYGTVRTMTQNMSNRPGGADNPGKGGLDKTDG